jgi:hypothetical protein
MTNALALILLFQVGAPNTATMSYPTLGYALFGGHLIHLTGIPGACSASRDPSNIEYVAVQNASTTRAALLSYAGDSPALVYRTPLSDTVYPIGEKPTATTLSPSGLYFAALSAARLSLYRRSDGKPVPAATVPVDALPLPVRDIRGLLASDKGDLVLQTDTGFWFSSDPASPPAFTFVPMPLTGMRFTPLDELLVAWEPGQGRIIALHPHASFAIEPLLNASDLAGSTPRLELSADGLSLWISQLNGSLVEYDVPRRQATFYSVPAGTLAAVTTPGVFLWDAPDHQFAVLDTTQSGGPRVLVVPLADGEHVK